MNELLKLAPAADPTQVLIGVYPKDSRLKIWGLIEAGTEWWDFIRGQSSVAIAPPNAFTVSSKTPGQISITRSGILLLILDQGKVIDSSSEVFSKGPVADFLKKDSRKFNQEIRKRLEADGLDTKWIGNDSSDTNITHFLQRIVNRVREKFHGGALIMVPDEIHANDTRLTDRVVIKYPCSYDCWSVLTDEYFTNIKSFELSAPLSKKKEMTSREYRDYQNARFEHERAEEMIKRAAGFLSSLTAVDGAVVITDRFRLLGFGAEIVAVSPSLKRVVMITDFEKSIGEYRDVELFGTRHRSAFRFCSSFENSVAFIVSQDGEIRIAKRVGSEVLVWSNINVGSLGF